MLGACWTRKEKLPYQFTLAEQVNSRGRISRMVFDCESYCQIEALHTHSKESNQALEDVN